MLGLQVYFSYFKAKIRWHTVVWQGFLTQKDGKDVCNTGVERQCQHALINAADNLKIRLIKFDILRFHITVRTRYDKTEHYPVLVNIRINIIEDY